jgi:hypothetical protein
MKDDCNQPDYAELARERAKSVSRGASDKPGDIARVENNAAVDAQVGKKPSDLADLNGALRPLKKGKKAANLAPDQRGK